MGQSTTNERQRIMSRVSTSLVQQWLGVSRQTVDVWHNEGQLVRVAPGQYLEGAVDRLLSSMARNVGKQPTWQSLVQSGHPLVGIAKAAELCGVHVARLRRLCEDENVPHFRLPGANSEYRFGVQGLHSLRELLQPSVSVQFAAYALGYKTPAKVLAIPGIYIVPGRTSSQSKKRFITTASFRACLADRLPKWVPAEDWIDDRQAHEAPLVGIKEVAETLSWGRHALKVYKDRLEQERAWYITRPTSGGAELLTSALWLRAQLQPDRECSVQDVAQLFGVSEHEVHVWRESGLIRCEVSGHDHRFDRSAFLRLSCWETYVKFNCSPLLRAQAQRFVAHRLLSGRPLKLLTSSDVAAYMRLPHHAIADRAERGKLLCIWLPNGHLRFMPGWVRRSMLR